MEVDRAKLEELMTGSKESVSHPFTNSLKNVQVELSVSIGETKMPIGDLTRLQAGQQIPLDKNHTDPCILYVGGIAYAHVELLDRNGEYAVKIIELLGK